MLRKSWNTDKKNSILYGELGKRYWGTIGKYMKECQIRGFVEEIGHEAVDLLDGADKEKSKEDKEGGKAKKVNQSGLIAATQSIVLATTKIDDEEMDRR